MKKIVIIALLLVLSSLGGYAQRFAYVDSDCVNQLEVNDDLIKMNQQNISEYIQLSLF
jgi:hypothetical protein